jgi:flagellin
MSSSITLTAGVRQNLLSLQTTAAMMATTQNRLATGKKVNTALDNPTNFFTAASLTSRAGDISALLDSMSNGIKSLEAADNGLSAITKTVASMQSTLRQARQDKSFETSSYTLDTTALANGTLKSLSLSGGAVGSPPVDIALNTASGVAPGGGGAATTTKSDAGVSLLDLPDLFTNMRTAWTYGSTAYDTTTAFAQGDSITIKGVTINFDGTKDGGGPIADTITHKYTAAEAAAFMQTKLMLGGASINVATATGDDGKTYLDLHANSGGALNNFSVSGLRAISAGVYAGGFSQASFTTANGNDAGGTGTSFDIAVNGGTTKTITFTAADLMAGPDGSNSGYNINNYVSVIDAKLQDSGITNVHAVLEPHPISVLGRVHLEATTPGAGTTFSISNVTGGAVGTTVIQGSDGGGGGGTTTTAKSVDALVAEINANHALEGKVRASNDNGKLRIENQSTSALSVGGYNISTGKIDGSSGIAKIAGNDVRKNLVDQFNNQLDQLDKLADDASYNGINLLHADKLKITFNESGTSAIDIQAKNPAGKPRSIDASELGIDTAVDSDFDSDETIDAHLDALSRALNTLRSQASSFGSNLSIVENRQSFAKAMVNTLQTGGDALVLADTNEEGAGMLALQTRQQLSTTALSLANQANQAVLRLF